MNVLRNISACIAISFFFSTCASAQEQGFTAEDLHKLQSVGDVQISPNGQHIAYTVSYRDKPARSYSRIWMMDLKTGNSEQFDASKNGGGSPRWSPDGNSVAFIGSYNKQRGLIIASADGKSAKFITETKGTNHPLPSSGERISWSPDGKQIAYISSLPGPESAQANGDPVVVTRYLYKPTASEGSTRFNDNRRMHIFIADINNGSTRQLTHGNYYEHSVDWSPDGSEILFISNRTTNPDKFFNYDIFTVNVMTGKTRAITHTENAEYQPRWSPDGKQIVYLGTKRGLTSSETTMEDTHVWLVNRNGENRHEITGDIDNRQRRVTWAKNGRAVYFTVQDKGSTHLYKHELSKGKSSPVIQERGRLASYTMAKDGSIAYSFTNSRNMAQLYQHKKGRIKQLTHLNQKILNIRTASKIEAINFQSFDGLPAQAFLTLPVNVNPDKKYPLIVMIHGGPHGQQGPTFNLKAQVYAAQGFATLMVNYRGSTGYGQAFADAIFADQNGGEAKDVIYGTRTALSRYPWLNPNRVGVEGGSYGGQLANWLITQTDMYKAAISISSISNLVSFNYMAYYHDYLAVEFGGLPHEGDLMDVLWERSPLKHVAKVKTPTMLVHGENDNDVPIAEAEQYYIALHDVGVEVVMVRYPREGHGVRENGHVVDLIDRSIAWYRKHFISSK